MKFKVGDKVKFLNEKGGGVVSKVVSPALVYVSIEEGFDVPVVPNELVYDMSDEYNNNTGEDQKSNNIKTDEVANRPVFEEDVEDTDERKSAVERVSFRGEYPEGIYLAYVPQDQKWIITGLIDIYLVNYSEYDIIYSVFIQNNEGNYDGFDYDSLAPKSKIIIDTFERENIEKWTKGVCQVLFHKDKPERLLLPANAVFDVKQYRISKESNYKETPLMSEKAFVLNLVEIGKHPVYSDDEISKKYDHIPPTGKAKQKPKKTLIDKHKTSEGEAVVDLHIGELVNNISGLSSAGMLKLQKDYFIRTLESAIKEGYKRVTFIHGVGNGVLRDEIVKLMKEYENLEKRSASLTKYGVGAIDVMISS